MFQTNISLLKSDMTRQSAFACYVTLPTDDLDATQVTRVPLRWEIYIYLHLKPITIKINNNNSFQTAQGLYSAELATKRWERSPEAFVTMVRSLPHSQILPSD